MVPHVATTLLHVHKVVRSQIPGTLEQLLSRRMKVKFATTTNIFAQTVCGYSLFHPNDLPYGQQHPTKNDDPRKRLSRILLEIQVVLVLVLSIQMVGIR